MCGKLELTQLENLNHLLYSILFCEAKNSVLQMSFPFQILPEVIMLDYSLLVATHYAS